MKVSIAQGEINSNCAHCDILNAVAKDSSISDNFRTSN